MLTAPQLTITTAVTMDMVDVASAITTAIRVDVATNKGSVIDVIRLVHPDIESKHASTYFTRMTSENPEVAARTEQIRVNRKGKLTPVADFGTLVHIIFCLPGKAARDFRARSAHQICRLMGGDVKIIAEVQARNKWWQATPARRDVQRALLAQPPARSDVDPAEDTARERDVRDDLALALNGVIEYETPVGFADVVTDTHVIEVKHWRQWKHALGQVLAYHAFASDKKTRIHLFADECDQVAAQSTVTIATGVCAKYDVSVTLEVRSSDAMPSKRARLE